MSKHLGKARYPALAVLAVVTIVLFARIQLIERSRAHAAASMLVPTSAELAAALIRSGLDAPALAAAGLSPADVDAVVADVYEHLVDTQTLLELADASLADARGQAAALKRVIQSGRATEQQVDAYPVATNALAQAQVQCDTLLAGIFDAGTDGLGQGARDTLAAIGANRGWKQPVEFLVVGRSEAQWVQLRDCLADERIAGQLPDTEPDPDAQAVLAQLRSDPQVAAARASLDAGGDVVLNAWQQAVAGQ